MRKMSEESRERYLRRKWAGFFDDPAHAAGAEAGLKLALEVWNRRKQRGLTRADLAKVVPCSEQPIEQLEREITLVADGGVYTPAKLAVLRELRINPYDYAPAPTPEDMRLASRRGHNRLSRLRQDSSR